jgi:hypothetical protein
LEEDQDAKHYLLKCTDGIFAGKFLFINTTPDGELFGSGDPEINQDITMYIESANLSERHAQIKYVDRQGKVFEVIESAGGSEADEGQGAETEIDPNHEGRYALSDCQSENGTWTRIQSAYAYSQHGRLIDLHQAMDREFKVDQNYFIIQPDTCVETLDEVTPWLHDWLSQFNKSDHLHPTELSLDCTEDKVEDQKTSEVDPSS